MQTVFLRQLHYCRAVSAPAKSRGGEGTLSMLIKIICLAICALLLFICYRAKTFAEKVLRRQEPSETLLFRIKLAALAVSVVLFVFVMIFIK